MFKILKYLKKQDWCAIILATGLIVVQVWLDLTMPDYTTKLTQAAVSTGATMNDIWYNGGMMLLCALGSMLAAFACGYLCARLAGTMEFRIREQVYGKISTFSSAEMKKFSVPSLITRTTNDVNQIQMFVAVGLQMLIKAPILAIWAISKISATSVGWTTATLVCVAIVVALVGAIIAIVLPKFKKIQKLNDNLNDATRENLSGVRVVRAFNAEDYQQKKFEKANKDLAQNQLFTSKMTGLLMPILTVCMNGLTLAIYWIGAIMMNNQSAISARIETIGNMTAFVQVALQVVMAFIMLIAIFIVLPRAIVSARRINEVLDAPVSIKEGAGAVAQAEGTVEFKNVSFAYPDGSENVISDINFVANKGETIAIIGATGAGKTTLIDLIPRFNDCTSGEVLVDGVDVKDYAFEELNNKVAMISQKACLFKGDIKDNIIYGCNENVADDDPRLARAIDVAEAQFVYNLDGGLHAPVAQGGTNYSGGQKQRLSIARAVFKDAEIIIFDDSFSALDYKTDMLVRKKIKQQLADKTIFIVAQRIGTIRQADKILVLEDGKIVGMGKHSELLETCPIYKEIALSQLSKEEV